MVSRPELLASSATEWAIVGPEIPVNRASIAVSCGELRGLQRWFEKLVVYRCGKSLISDKNKGMESIY